MGMVLACVTLVRGPFKPTGISHRQKGETSAPCASEKPSHGQEAVHNCTCGLSNQEIPIMTAPQIA